MCLRSPYQQQVLSSLGPRAGAIAYKNTAAVWKSYSMEEHQLWQGPKTSENFNIQQIFSGWHSGSCSLPVGNPIKFGVFMKETFSSCGYIKMQSHQVSSSRDMEKPDSLGTLKYCWTHTSITAKPIQTRTLL